MTTDIQPGEVVWVQGGEKVRPGVVVRVMAGSARDAAPDEPARIKVLVPWGTGTFRPEKHPVAVEPRTAAGTALGIEKPTYFYRGNVTICDAARAQRTGRRCPPELFLRLSALVGL